MTGALNVLVVIAALTILDLGESGVGVLNAAIGVGGLDRRACRGGIAPP